jgi:hypothetical protein
MADTEDHSENESERRHFSRRAFLTGGAVVGGTVLWGSAAAEASPPGGSSEGRPTIPHGQNETGGTGSTGGFSFLDAGTPNPELTSWSSGSSGRGTGVSVETGFGPNGSSATPLFPFRFR